MTSDNSQSKYRWYVLSMATVVSIFVYAVATVCMSVLFAEISEELGLNLVEVGTVWGSVSMAGVVIMLFAGMLGDRFGARRVITIACLLAVVFGSLRGLADSFVSLAVTSFLFGFTVELIPMNVMKMVSQWFHDRWMGTAQGVTTMGVGAGYILGSMLSATVLSPLLGGWRNVIYFFGAISLVVTIIWLVTVREPDRQIAPTATAAHGFRESLSHVFRVKTVWLVGITLLGLAGCYQSVLGYLPLYLRNIGWTGVSADGALAAFNAASTIFAIPVLMLSDRVGLRKAFFLGGTVIAIIGTGLLSIVTGPAVWFLIFILGSMRDACVALLITTTIEAEGTGPEYAGTACGLVGMLSRIGISIGPPLGNSLAVFSPGMPFVLWAGMAVIALVSALLLKETGRKRVQN